jgi:AcrR family transcriptional regulator
MGAQETVMAVPRITKPGVAKAKQAAAKKGRPRSFDRAAALKAAMQVFWQRGYEATSLSDLTRAMGINAPSLYAAFDCKEALFGEALTLYQATEGAEPQRLLQEAPTAKQGFTAMLRYHATDYVNPQHPPGCMAVLAAITGAPENKSVRALMTRTRRAAVDGLAARIRRGISAGDVPKSADAVAMAAFYTTLMQGMSIQARDGATKKQLLATVEAAMVAWDGMAGRK